MSEEQRAFDDFVLLERTKCNIEKMQIDSLVDIFCFCVDQISQLKIPDDKKEKILKKLTNYSKSKNVG